jgi:hypothetical protein
MLLNSGLLFLVLSAAFVFSELYAPKYVWDVMALAKLDLDRSPQKYYAYVTKRRAVRVIMSVAIAAGATLSPYINNVVFDLCVLSSTLVWIAWIALSVYKSWGATKK